MAANLKGLSGIKGLALRHGEKILIALFGALALYFVYSSLSLPSLEDRYQADKLQSAVTQARAAVTDSKWPEEGSETITEVRPFVPIVKSDAVAVEAKQYPFKGFDESVIPPSLLRIDPPVLNATNVRATGGSGLLAFRDEKTLAEQERRRALKEEEDAKKLEDEQKKQAEEGGLEGGGRRNRNRPGEDPEAGNDIIDPEHPERRMVEGVASPAGVPLQGGERLERGYWATVVATVPIREQLKLFQDAFQNARGGYDPARDFPRYVGFEVQRADVQPGKPLEWKRVPVFDGQRNAITANKPLGYFVSDTVVNKLMQLASTQWAGPAIEPVDPRWMDPMLTMPVPPLVGRDFGADATHPDIPLAINAPPVEQDMPEAPVEEATDQPVDSEEGFTASGTAGQMPMAGGTYGGGVESSGYPRGAYGGGLSRGEFGGREREGAMGGRMTMPQQGGSAGPMSMSQRTELPRSVDSILLRFFDYSVEPGKKYKYRVRIVIADPNFGIPATVGMLDPSVVDRQKKDVAAAKAKSRPIPYYRAAQDWSEPSPTVGIPVGGTVHVAEAKQPSGKTANDEPVVKMIAETFDTDPADGSAIHVALEKEYRRGAVVNLREKMKFAGENDTWTDVKDSYEINTGLTLLDVEGADKLVKEVTSPARVLVMDPAGGISVRDELTDSTEVGYLRLIFGDEKRRNRTDQPDGEFGGEMPRGMRGRGPGGPR